MYDRAGNFADIERLATTASQRSDIRRWRGTRAGGSTLILLLTFVTIVDDDAWGERDREGRSIKLGWYRDAALPGSCKIGSCLCCIKGERAVCTINKRELYRVTYSRGQVAG